MHEIIEANTTQARQLSLPSVGAIFIIVLIIGGYFSYVQVKQTTQDFYHDELQTNSSEIDSYFQSALTQYQRDVRFLANTPPIAGLHRAEQHGGIDPLDGTEYAQWKSRLETIFVSYLQFNPYIDQLRIIKASGQEEIRVERADNQVQIAGQLQNKADRPYFIESIALAPGEMYVSPVSLNQEFGKVQYPLLPVMRFSLAIFDESNKLWGILIANINAGSMLATMRSLVQPPEAVILTSASGHFITHPDSRLDYSAQLTPAETWSKRYAVKEERAGAVLSFSAVDESGKFIGVRRQLRFGSAPEDYMTAMVYLPEKAVSDTAMSRNLIVFAVLILLAGIAYGVMYLFSRSAQKSAELAETRALAGNIVSQSFDAIISLDESGKVLSWNGAAQRLFGVPSAHAVGSPFTAVDGLEGFDLDRQLEQLNINNQSHRVVNYELPAKEDESPRTITVSMNKLTPEATRSHIALIVRDVSAQVEAEKAIRRTNELLESEVAERTRQLEQARDEAQQHSAVKSGFISNISHEMRTPLNGIIGGLKLLRKEPQTSKGKHYVELIDTSANALGVLINDILDLSKIEAGKLDLVPQTFAPRDLVETLCKSMAVKAYEKGLEFFIDVSGISHSQVTLDKNRFTQILNNLINNACKFTHKGYIWVRAWDETCESGDLQLYVSIIDTGIGISEQNQAKLFEAFTQAKSTIAIHYGGTGLGLSISRQLAILLGGNIHFTSTEGKGSEFTVVVKADKAIEDTPETQLPLKDKRIALCASNKNVKHWAERICTTLGAQVYGADSLPASQSGVQYNRKAVDALIAEQDCLLDSPYSDALESGEYDTLPPILLMTAPGEELKFQYRAGPVIQLYKPVSENEIVRALQGDRPSARERILPVPDSDEVDSQTLKQIKGASVLIVDDNETNLAIAVGILEHLSLTIYTAENGLQAIDKLKSLEQQNTPCHCVLMDCQMPVLSGYDATQRIREGMAGEHHTNVAIVAMTANAMSGEREHCMACGMDDYITKPLNFSEVQQSVISFITKAYSNGDVEQTQAEQALEAVDSPEIHASDIIAWDKNAALKRLRGKESLYKKVCGLFVQRLPMKIQELDDGLKGEAFDEIRKSAHALKGMCADIGANQIAAALQNIETDAAKGGSPEHLKASFEEVKAQLWQLLELVESYLDNG